MSSTSRPDVTLEGRYVVLEPLTMAHHAGLVEAGDEATFRWYAFPVAGDGPMRAFVQAAIADRDKGAAIPFAVRTRHDGAVVGSTRFGAIDWQHARGEIGWTWYAPHVRRTPVNTECKRLLLAYGFDVLGYRRIEFKTDSLNAASRAAILRIGAKEEGTFRNHMITTGGRARHSVYYSIIAEEWPTVRDGLDARLARPFSFAAPVT